MVILHECIKKARKGFFYAFVDFNCIYCNIHFADAFNFSL